MEVLPVPAALLKIGKSSRFIFGNKFFHSKECFLLICGWEFEFQEIYIYSLACLALLFSPTSFAIVVI